MDHYRLEPPFYVSFSGGRTSGYLLRHVLDAFGGELPQGGHAIFANTGKEHEATLEFVEEVSRRWCPVTWLEWVDLGKESKPSQTFRVVDFRTASRNGEPFEALIRRRQMVPTPLARFCSGELKVYTIHRFLRSLGYSLPDVTEALGLRADEPRRVAAIRANKKNRNMIAPLASMNVTRPMINEWWKQQAFDLRLPDDDNAFGNCDLCFLKSRDRTDRVIMQNPERADWWASMEELAGKPFRIDRPLYRNLKVQVTIQGRLFAGMQDDTMPCDCTE